MLMADFLDSIDPWVDRWVELTAGNDDKHFEALWHQAVANQRRRRWLKVLATCDDLLNLRPEDVDVSKMRSAAAEQLESLINNNVAKEPAKVPE